MTANITQKSIHNQGSEYQSIKPLLASFGIDAPDIAISDLVLDSREVAIHKGFVAVSGHALDGRDFIPQAVSLGAKVILAECDDAQSHGHLDMREQSLILSFYQLPESLSALAAAFYHAPAEKLEVIAVTGTNGKTSTVQLTSQLASLLGQKVASIGTLGAGLFDTDSRQQVLDNTINTTPDAISMQRILAEFVSQKVTQVALEASSHALVQHRIAALKTDVAVFTNLSRDHLDYHNTMSSYAQAKRQLLKQPGLRFAVLNADDQESQNWQLELPADVKSVFFSTALRADYFASEQQFCIAQNIEYVASGCRFTLLSSWGECDIQLALMGQFNVSNVLAAICVQLCLGKSLQDIAKAASQLSPVAGRMEVFTATNKPSLVVDYAHTPDALKQALQALREHCQGKLWCVFGCGGDRDKGKRLLMGEIAEKFADHTIITNDNSRTEDPAQIAQQILAGCLRPEVIQVELDRRKAIKLAHEQAASNDIILIAGKGHEDYQIIGSQTVSYDERAFVKQQQKQRNAP
ncbi:MAG: UDP-N-acetylmuramoyl-L-alanyl-D-glutamate--2,6-diaminopimelate ligase [Paraglaciecola sp.]|jgi:UDP-N-acetylmuramoyl-L-alanyl-D-glutamate--2,6-diaminopimelate ligase